MSEVRTISIANLSPIIPICNPCCRVILVFRIRSLVLSSLSVMIFRLGFRSATNLCPLFAASLRQHVRVSQIRQISLYQKFIEEVKKGFQKDKNVQESLKELDRRKEELERSATVQTIKKATVELMKFPPFHSFYDTLG